MNENSHIEESPFQTSMSLSIPLKSSNFGTRKSSDSDQVSPLLRPSSPSYHEDKSSRSGGRSNKSSFSRASKNRMNNNGHMTAMTADSSDNFGMALLSLSKPLFPT